MESMSSRRAQKSWKAEHVGRGQESIQLDDASVVLLRPLREAHHQPHVLS